MANTSVIDKVAFNLELIGKIFSKRAILGVILPVAFKALISADHAAPTVCSSTVCHAFVDLTKLIYKSDESIGFVILMLANEYAMGALEIAFSIGQLNSITY